MKIGISLIFGLMLGYAWAYTSVNAAVDRECTQAGAYRGGSRPILCTTEKAKEHPAYMKSVSAQ